MAAADDILRWEELEIERLQALGLGRYDAIRAFEAGIDWRTIASARPPASDTVDDRGAAAPGRPRRGARLRPGRG